MGRASLGHCLALLALGCAVVVCGLDVAQSAELPNISRTVSKPRADTPRTSVCKRPQHRRSVVQKPLKEPPPCTECPPVQPCGNCPCDLTQLIAQITNNNTTNTTTIENQLKFGFDKLL